MSRHKVRFDQTLLDVSYLHFRPFVERTAWRNGVRVAVPEVWPFGGATLAIAEGIEDGQPVTFASLSQCHESDRYIKELGRERSRGRLQAAIFRKFKNDGSFYTSGLDKIYVLPGAADVTLNELIEEIEDATGYITRR